jgi:hypothetical protein
MNIKDLRRLYLLASIEKAGGKIKSLAETLETDPNYISSIKGGSREVSDELAEKIEARFGFPAWGVKESALLRAAAIEILKDNQDIDDLLIVKLSREGHHEIAEMVRNSIPTLIVNESKSLTPEERMLAAQQLIDLTFTKRGNSNVEKNNLSETKGNRRS